MRLVFNPSQKSGMVLGPRGILSSFFVLASLSFFAAATPSPLFGQIQRSIGVHIGQVQARQIWSGPISTETVNGLTVGVNVDVPTPARYLSIRAGAGYVGRGSEVREVVIDGGEVSDRVRSHYLSFPFHGKLSLRLGPGSVYGFAGPTLETLLSTSCTEGFCSVLAGDKPLALSATAGFGLALDVGERFRAEFEVLVTEGLTDAYLAAPSGVRYRSLEFVFRSSIPF